MFKRRKRINHVVLVAFLSFSVLVTDQLAAACKIKPMLNFWGTKIALSFRRSPKVLEENLLESTDRYTVSRGTLRIPMRRGEIKVNYDFFDAYKEGGELPPVIFLYSGIGGRNRADSYIARYYANHGVSTVITHYKEGFNEITLDSLRERSFRTLNASMAVTDFIIRQKQVDEKKLGLLGISYGGIRGAYIALLDKRFKAVTLVVASGSLSKTVAYSEQDDVKKLRQRIMVNNDIDEVEQFREKYKRRSLFEPVDVTCGSSYDHVSLHIATHDKWVPTLQQLELAQAMPNSTIEVYRLAHRGTYAWFAARELKSSLDFFTKFW